MAAYFISNHRRDVRYWHKADMPTVELLMSAFGGKADDTRTLNELVLSYIGPFPSAGSSRYDALS